MPGLEIWRSASRLVELHGQRAADQAVQGARDAALSGDTGGARAWFAIAVAILELERDIREPGEAVH
jgi:hypothetical protein